MENNNLLLKKYQEFRHKNVEYFNYCQGLISQIANNLVDSDVKYKLLVQEFDLELKKERQEINSFVEKLEELRANIIQLNKEMNEKAQVFDSMVNDFEDKKLALKQTAKYAPLAELDNKILESFESTMQKVDNKYHDIYKEDIKLVNAIKESKLDLKQ